MDEIGLKVLEHSNMLKPVSLALLKDEDPSVVCEAIISGMKFFDSILQDLVQQFIRNGKVERWAEEMWMRMIEFKDAILSLIFEPVSVRTKLLALKFLETYILVFTPGAADTDRLNSRGKERRFNVSWLPSGHPVLDPDKLISEANSLFSYLLDMLKSSNRIPGPLTVTVVNCLASIARKRPSLFGQVLHALLDFQSNSETRGGHAASLQYSVRSALLGFLRCTHPVIIESRDKFIRRLHLMNAGEAADQALRQVDKMLRNIERSSRDLRAVKEEQSSTQIPHSGDLMKRKAFHLHNDVRDNGVEMTSKRMLYSSNGKSSDQVQDHGSFDDNSSDGISSEASLANNNVNPVEQMIAVIAALLAEGERAADSLELLISQIHPDLLADIVITNMIHLPRTAPLATQGFLPSNAQSFPSASAAQVADSTSLPVHSQISAQQSSNTSTVTDSTSLPDLSGTSNLQVDSRRDPRRDPRRLDPRRIAVPVEAQSLPVTEETTYVSSVSEGPGSVTKSTSIKAEANAEPISPHFAPDTEVDAKGMRTTLVLEKEDMAKEEGENGSTEIPSSDDNVHVERSSRSSDLAFNETSIALTSMVTQTDVTGLSFVHESDDDSPPVLNERVPEETCADLPEIPSYIDLSEKQQQKLRKLAVEQIIKSYKDCKNKEFCGTRMSLIARLVSWMQADDLVAMMVQQDIVLDYKDQQGHELVMHVLYFLHGLITTESSELSLGATDLYEKFLTGVAKALLDTLPASDKSFSRLLGEAPMLTDSVMGLLENLCYSNLLNVRGTDSRDDRITQGLGAVWSLILGRPLNRQACLTIALKCAVHSEDDTRVKAIRLVSNKLYQLNYISETIEQYAKNKLLSAVECTSDAEASSSAGSIKEVGVDEETSVSSTLHSDSGKLHVVSQSGPGVSFSEAQRYISLYFALCTKKPDLLQLVFDAYARAGKSVKQAIHRHVPILLRSFGSSYPQLLRIISDPPMGSEGLLMLVLQTLAEQTVPSPDLISAVKHLYETKLKDVSILIPMLSSLSKNEVLPIFPRLVDLPLDKFRLALAHILQGSAHTGPALTPAEVLVAIHDIVPEKEGIALKKVTDACSACFEQRTVFTQHVLAKALNQMVDRTPLPLLFMRTVIQAIGSFPTLVDFIMEVLSKLVDRQIWRMPKLWVGFLKCMSQMQPHSFHVLLKLPTPQLESALNKYPNLRGPLVAYSSQSNIKSSLPSSTLAILGVSSESQMTNSHPVTSLHT